MKKRKLFLAILLIGGLLNSKAQSYKHAFGASYGVTKNGTGVMLSHNYFLKFHDNIETSVLISDSESVHQSGVKINYKTTTLTSGYSKNIYISKNNGLSVNANAGLLVGYESINKKDPSLNSVVLNNSNPIFGGHVGVDIDYVLNDKFSLFAKANQYYHINSDLGNLTSFIGGGLRFYIN
jgi:hypothetical protein